MPAQGDDQREGQELHPLLAEDARPQVVADGLAGQQHLRQQHDGEQRHEQRGGALRHPVAQAVMRTGDDALASVGCHC